MPQAAGLGSGVNYHNFQNTIPGSMGHSYHSIGATAPVKAREIAPPRQVVLSPSSSFGRDMDMTLQRDAPELQPPPVNQPQPLGFPQRMHGQISPTPRYAKPENQEY